MEVSGKLKSPGYFTPRRIPVLIEEEAGCAREPVWIVLGKRKSLCPTRIQILTVLYVDSSYSDWAITDGYLAKLFQFQIQTDDDLNLEAKL